MNRRRHQARDDRAFRVLLWLFAAGVVYMATECVRQGLQAAGVIR